MPVLAARCVVELTTEEVADCLGRDGLVIFRQGTPQQLTALLTGWTQLVAHPHDATPGVTVIDPHSPRGWAADEVGFTRSHLPPHTDRSLQRDPPSLLVALMVTPAPSGGETLLVDGARVLTELRRSFDDAAIADLVLRTSVTRTTDVHIVQVGNGLVRLRLRDDGVAAPVSTDGRRDLVSELRRLITTATMRVRLAPGDGYVLHNHRYLHGRTAFAGDRSMIRMLARVDDGHPCSWLNRGFRDA